MQGTFFLVTGWGGGRRAAAASLPFIFVLVVCTHTHTYARHWRKKEEKNWLFRQAGRKILSPLETSDETSERERESKREGKNRKRKLEQKKNEKKTRMQILQEGSEKEKDRKHFLLCFTRVPFLFC